MKILCIGKNYALHAKEMNSSVPSQPVFFLKPDTALLTEGNDFYYPDFTQNLHHEIEVVIKIGKPGKHIPKEFVKDHISAYSVGIDFTARDLQDKAKEKGMPWEIAKAFDHSAFISNTWIEPGKSGEWNHLGFHLLKNGEKVQEGNTSDMIFDVESVISYLSTFITLRTGDLIYTGTPHGVGPVNKGDKLEGFLSERSMFTLPIR